MNTKFEVCVAEIVTTACDLICYVFALAKSATEALNHKFKVYKILAGGTEITILMLILKNHL